MVIVIIIRCIEKTFTKVISEEARTSFESPEGCSPVPASDSSSLLASLIILNIISEN